MDETDATKLTRTRGDFGVSGLTPGRDPILRNEELLMPFFCWFLCASTALLLVWNETWASRSGKGTYTGARTSGGNRTRRDCGSGRWGAQRGGAGGGAGVQCCTNTHGSISHPLGSDRDEKRPA